ncbi:TPA: phage tail tape measure protein, partial [Shigella flexneri]|nr:phage tail tape measure protein [Shigella flexneri]
EAFAGNLQQAMKDLTPGQRNAAMATIFGSDAVRAANVIYEQGAEGIGKWIDAVDDQGYASEQAAIRMDNLKGDIEALGGSLETALINGGSGANDTLRTLVQAADGLVDAIGRIPGPVLTAGVAIAGIGGLTLLAAGGIGKMVIGANNALSAMQSLGVISEATGNRISGAATKAGKFALKAGGVALGALALAKALDSISQSGRAAELGVEGVTAALLAGDQAAIFDQYGSSTQSYADAMDALVGGGFDDKMNR